MNPATLLCIITLAHMLVAYPASAEQLHKTNSETGAQTWSQSAEGVYFSLTQILPEQGDAFYVNRGFTLEEAAPYTSSCVFMTVLRNDSAPGAIHFVLDDWSVFSEGRELGIKPVSVWLQEFAERGIKKSAQIAFRWAQFPAEQTYEPGGDWNQGMLSVGLSAGVKFDITARWSTQNIIVESTLEGVECAS